MSKQGIFIGLNYWILWREILFCHFWFSLHGDGQESVVNSHKSGMWVGNESVEVPLPVNKRRKSYLSSALWKISEYYNQLALQNEPFILQMNFEFHRLRLQLVTVLILVCRLSKLTVAALESVVTFCSFQLEWPSSSQQFCFHSQRKQKPHCHNNNLDTDRR